MKRVLAVLARLVFVVACLAFAGWGLDGRWREIGAEIRAVGIGQACAALLLTVAGLLGTGQVWRLCVGGFGHRIAPATAARIFFVGQLGKYLPGSVWSVAAQARMGRDLAVPARVTAAASLIFLGLHVATALVVAGVIGLVRGDAPVRVPALATVAGVVGVLPVVVRMIARRLGGADFDGGAGLRAAGLMLPVWGLYGAALALLVPAPSARVAVVLLGAFALAYAAGVVVVLAPAGFGAREAVFVAVATPVLSVAGATAVALLARVVHTLADLLLAAWCGGRRTPGSS